MDKEVIHQCINFTHAQCHELMNLLVPYGDLLAPLFFLAVFLGGTVGYMLAGLISFVFKFFFYQSNDQEPEVSRDHV